MVYTPADTAAELQRAKLEPARDSESTSIMQPSQQERARNLDALHQAIAVELANSQTLALLTSHTTAAGEMVPAVRAWLNDWLGYHLKLAENPIVKACLPVALQVLNPTHVASAVRHLHFEEWHDTAMRETAGPPELEDDGNELTIQCPENPHPKHASQIVVRGDMRTVPACVAGILADIDGGAEVVTYRPETAEALQQHVPEIVAGLTRDWTRKVVGKHASYAVAPWVAKAVRHRVPNRVQRPASG
jgi:hypothetical protein